MNGLSPKVLKPVRRQLGVATAVFLVTTTMIWLAFAAAVGEFWLRMRVDTNEEA
jgi:hypothetical protein